MNPKRLAGFSLIEVLVSLLLVSFILLGFEAAEVYSLRVIRAANYFNLANNQLANMVERLRVLGDSSSLLQETAAWNIQNNNLLPHGFGEITGHYPVYNITLYWGDIKPSCQQNSLGNSGCITQTITV